jgi:transcriptional regulator with XRE-family HTH domain
LISVLRAARTDVQLTQAQLAQRLKRPQSFVAKYEAGERRIDVVEFLQIADALRADPCAILRRMR